MTFDWKTAIAAPLLVAVVLSLGGYLYSKLAWAEDIKQLTRGQVDQAVELYSNKVQTWIAQTPPPTASANQTEAWKAELDHAKQQLNQAEQRKLDLSK